MNTKLTKGLSLLTALLMLFCMLPFHAFALSAYNERESGKITDNGTERIKDSPPSEEPLLNAYITTFPVTYGDGYWAEFSPDEPENITEYGSMETVYAAAYAGGMVYGFTTPNEQVFRFFVMDAETHQVFPTDSQVDDKYICAMAYDHTRETMFALAMDYNYNSGLYTVNLGTEFGALTHVADIQSEESILAFAIDGEGNGYCLAEDEEDAPLYRVDLDTGECTFIANTGVAFESLQSMTWDYNTNMLYWAQFGSETDTGLYTIDPVTGETAFYGKIGDGGLEVTGLWIADDKPVPPIEPPEFVVSFVDGYTHETIEEWIVEGGTVLDESIFPEPPDHSDDECEFLGWDYDGAPIYRDLTIKARYYNPNAVHLNAFFNHGYAGGEWGHFTDSAPEEVDFNGEMPTTWAAAYAGGKVYGYLWTVDWSTWTYDTRFYIIDAETILDADPNTFDIEYTGLDAEGKIVCAMAYNHANDTMYALATEIEGDGTTDLYKVNLALGFMQHVAHVETDDSKAIYTLAIDGEGNAYGLSAGSNSGLYNIDLETGACTLIGNTGIPLDYAQQGMTWDYNTEKLFWAQYSELGSGLYIIDPVTANATACGQISEEARITGLWIANDMPVGEITVPDFTVTFMNGLTDEEIEGSLTVPAGTVLDEADFPEPPVYDYFVFTGWDYDGKPIVADTVITAMYKDINLVGYYFETDPIAEGWRCEDRDSDGFNWLWTGDLPMGPRHIIPEGEACMVSYSWDENTGGPLFPDNWLISPDVPGGGFMTFMILAQDPNWFGDPVGVYVSTDGGVTWSDELGYFEAGSEVQTFEVDLSDYPAQSIQIGFRHYNVSDIFCVNLDAVEVTGDGQTPEPPPTEEPPTEEPPTETPTEPPAPPATGFISLAGAGIAAILTGAGIVMFRRKRR